MRCHDRSPSSRAATVIGCALVVLRTAVVPAAESFPLDHTPASVCTAEGERLCFRFDSAPTSAALRLPRLDNEVVEVSWEPVTDATAATPDGDPAGPPEVVPPERLLGFSQTPDTWAIDLPGTIRYPARIVLRLASAPRHAPHGHVCTATGDGTITLPARHALVFGEKLQFEPRLHKNTVGYWVNEQDRAHWLFTTAAPGRWEVHVLQGCGAGQGGSRVRFACGASAAEFVVVDTGHFQNFRWRSVGLLDIPAGERHVLDVSCVEKQQAAVMDIRQIRLVPAGDPPPGGLTLDSTAPDVLPPPVTAGDPAPGRKALVRLPEPSRGSAYHTLSLPTDWTPSGRWPVLVEWAGNGPFVGPHGERNTGRVEDASLAHGLAGTDGCIVLGLPFLDETGTRPVTTWWGSPPSYDSKPTLAYAEAALADVYSRFGGDPQRVMLVGFSRGSIACNALGLADDRIAALWQAAICFSHYDGLRDWPFPGSTGAAARERLGRLRGRPQLIIAESFPTPDGGLAALEEIRRHLDAADAAGRFTFLETGFAEHDDAWALRPSAARQAARAWLSETLGTPVRDESL